MSFLGERFLPFQLNPKLVTRVIPARIRINLVEKEKKFLCESFMFKINNGECQNDSNA